MLIRRSDDQWSMICHGEFSLMPILGWCLTSVARCIEHVEKIYVPTWEELGVTVSSTPIEGVPTTAADSAGFFVAGVPGLEHLRFDGPDNARWYVAVLQALAVGCTPTVPAWPDCASGPDRCPWCPYRTDE
jgi:hypothetical protein